MSKVLFVPTRTDALFLKSSMPAAAARADFSQMPYFDGSRDHNPDRPFLSETILAHAFEDRNFQLGAGVHLHWALPEALTKTMSLPLLRRESFESVFGLDMAKALWQKLLALNWLAPIAGNTVMAFVTPRAQRRSAWDDSSQIDLLPTIESLLAQSAFPAVPNRWLVVRRKMGKREGAWLVESDYLHPLSESAGQAGVSFPVRPVVSTDPPFRYVGRTLPLALWQARGSAYLPYPLSAIGYGEPTFAAFYPNCHGIFGFYDPDITDPTVLAYEVIGWYDEANTDHLQFFLQNWKLCEGNFDRDLPEALQQLQALAEELGWAAPITVAREAFRSSLKDDDGTLWKLVCECGALRSIATEDAAREWLVASSTSQAVLNAEQLGAVRTLRAEVRHRQNDILNLFASTVAAQMPERMVCFSRVSFQHTPVPPTRAPINVALAVGNTGTEALSAYLGKLLAGEEQSRVLEDQLEALQLAGGLEQRQLDLGAKFEEARHSKSFIAQHAGTLWTIRLQAPEGEKANAARAHAQTQLSLEPSLAHLLNQANLLQREYDRGNEEIESLRGQLYADWCKYLVCAYPPEEAKPVYPSLDQCRDYVERRDLVLLKQKIATNGLLALQLENTNGDIARDLSGQSNALAARLARALNQLAQEIQTHNRKPATQQANASYVLKPTAGPRYWQPREPVLLLAGAEMQVSARHGQDGRWRDDGLLACVLVNDFAYEKLQPGLLNDAGLDALAARLDQIEKAAGAKHFAFNQIEAQPWNPFLLEWNVEFFPARDQSHEHNGGAYSSEYLLRNYALPSNKVELRPRAGMSPLKGANEYRGASILTPHASIHLKETLARRAVGVLKPLLMQEFFVYLKKQKPEASLAEQNESEVVRQAQEFNTWQREQARIKAQDFAPQLGEQAEPQFENWITNNLAALARWHRAQLRANPQSALALFYKTQNLGAQEPDAWLLANFGLFVQWFTTEVRTRQGRIKALLTDTQTVPQADAMQQLQAELSDLRAEAHATIVLHAYDALAHLNCLSQALSGFNQALLQRKQTLQLEIADPLAFPEYVDFAKEVRRGVLHARFLAPQPEDDFNPLRAGALNLIALRLVDTFGQVRELQWERALAAETLQPRAAGFPLALPPRLVQPARLNLRWLAADFAEVEMNDHPASNPICGWLLPNNLDNSVMVYDQNGQALGALTTDPEQPWQPAPGQAQRLFLDDIKNPHLQKVLRELIARQRQSLARKLSPTYLENFLSALDSALENIAPENFAQHQAQALLMGRPIALVRVALRWELQGLPANHQGWTTFHQDLRRFARETRAFEKVKLPLRLGEFRQFNDGLVGYWIEAEANEAATILPASRRTVPTLGAELESVAAEIEAILQKAMNGRLQRESFLQAVAPLAARSRVRAENIWHRLQTCGWIESDEAFRYNRFFAPQTGGNVEGAGINDDYIFTHEQNANDARGGFNLELALEEAPLTLTVLLDPRGSLHATSGILPTKAIHLPPDQFSAALQNLEISFLTAPILSDRETVNISLPEEPGYVWSWLEMEDDNWREVSATGRISRREFLQTLLAATPNARSTSADIWQSLIDSGWIKPEGESEHARVTPRDQRAQPVLEAALADLTPVIEAILARTQLGHFNSQAVFSGEQELREGWLKLKKAPAAH